MRIVATLLCLGIVAGAAPVRAELELRRAGREWLEIEDDGEVRKDGRVWATVRHCCGDFGSKRTVAAALAFFADEFFAE